MSAGSRKLLWVELAAFLGDYCRTRPENKEGSFGRHSKLHQPNQSLVHSLLLPKVTGALLSIGWWLHLGWMCSGCGFGSAC